MTCLLIAVSLCQISWFNHYEMSLLNILGFETDLALDRATPFSVG